MHDMLRMAGFAQIEFDTVGYERTLAFAAFRLLGYESYSDLSRRLPRICRWLESQSFFVDLRDIMFVVAQKPG
jgi:hypothetical protein